jgi:hypothetical protein
VRAVQQVSERVWDVVFGALQTASDDDDGKGY